MTAYLEKAKPASLNLKEAGFVFMYIFKTSLGSLADEGLHKS